MIPIKNLTKEEIYNSLLKDYISHYGLPKIIISDNHGSFINEMFKELCVLLRIKHFRTTSHHPQTNAFIERPHRQIDNSLKCLINSKINWLTALPVLQLLWNNCPSSNDQYTPAQKAFGKSNRLPNDLIEDNDLRETQLSNDQFKKILQDMHSLKPHKIQHKIIPKNLFTFKDLQSATHVWLKNDNKENKYDTCFTGPYKIIERSEDYYTLQHDNGQLRKHNICKLKLAYLSNPILEQIELV